MINEDEVNESFNNLVINDSYETPIKNTPINNWKVLEISDDSGPDESIAENILDELYGNSWRKKKDLILSKTEPRKKKQTDARLVTNSLCKPKFSLLYKNPYLDSEKSKSQNLKFTESTNSPYFSNVNSETTENSQSKKLPHTKLNFDESSDDNENIVESTKSKYGDVFSNENIDTNNVNIKRRYNNKKSEIDNLNDYKEESPVKKQITSTINGKKRTDHRKLSSSSSDNCAINRSKDDNKITLKATNSESEEEFPVKKVQITSTINRKKRSDHRKFSSSSSDNCAINGSKDDNKITLKATNSEYEEEFPVKKLQITSTINRKKRSDHRKLSSSSSDNSAINGSKDDNKITLKATKRESEEEFPVKKLQITSTVNRKKRSDHRKLSSSSSDNCAINGSNSNKITLKTTNSESKIDKQPTIDITSDSDDDDEWEKEVSKIERRLTIADDGTYSFFASLSANVPRTKCDPSALIFRDNYKAYKEQLLKKLFMLYNEKVFDNVLPRDLVLEWNDRMRKTAGKCSCKKITERITGKVERSARITLSTKVLDTADRLRDTLIHEMCHAATWLVNGVSDGHGQYWKYWAFKAMKVIPEIPPINRCHNYVIKTKYTYKCTNCGYSFGRHSKSLDVERKRCGYCYGKFELFINKTNKKGETVAATPKKEVTGFAAFVKENYGVYKTPLRTHAEVMKVMGQKFKELQTPKNIRQDF